MNPSASGWIPKFLTLVDKQQFTTNSIDENEFYNQLKETGFLYGVSRKSFVKLPEDKLRLTTDEFTKINLFYCLLFAFFKQHRNAEIKEAITLIIDFYKTLDRGKTSFLYKFSMSQTPSDVLEHVLASRLQESNSILKKNETTIIPYTLLYIDILAFTNFSSSNNNLKLYEQQIETAIINYCFLTLKAKKEKDKFDRQIIEQFETSTAYLTIQNKQSNFLPIETLKNQYNFTNFEKLYIFDLCCLAVWNDKALDEAELLFLKKLAKSFDITEKQLFINLNFIKHFSEKNSKSIALFENKNPIYLLYKQSTTTVKLLITRNKSRLLKELAESGELVKLIGQSTIRELSTDEKDKVKEQLLDICKTIPSLTIFLIPGGSLLLPLLVKYIPSLLPSAFQQNKIHTKNDKNH
ncbi:MAG: LETM1-related biofilm-associated protein [Flavobacteriaceae bacterium]|nr:LETM1-related biofilm-associated protein [Flavobacteriaceae bacterium]